MSINPENSARMVRMIGIGRTLTSESCVINPAARRITEAGTCVRDHLLLALWWAAQERQLLPQEESEYIRTFEGNENIYYMLVLPDPQNLTHLADNNLRLATMALARLHELGQSRLVERHLAHMLHQPDYELGLRFWESVWRSVPLPRDLMNRHLQLCGLAIWTVRDARRMALLRVTWERLNGLVERREALDREYAAKRARIEPDPETGEPVVLMVHGFENKNYNPFPKRG